MTNRGPVHIASMHEPQLAKEVKASWTDSCVWRWGSD